MIEDQFSAAAFEAEGLDTKSARKLANLLAGEIQNEMHTVIAAKLQEIVDRLNSMGHNLQFYGDPVPGDISYRDDEGTGLADDCRLRVAFNTVVSTGYSHLIRLKT